jgi:hypothetical protein
MKKLQINISDDLHTRLKIACTLEGKDMTTVLLKLVEEYVEKIGKRKLIVLSKKK